MLDHSCHRHVYGNTLVYVTNAFVIAECICSIFPQIISDETPPTEVLSSTMSPKPTASLRVYPIMNPGCNRVVKFSPAGYG